MKPLIWLGCMQLIKVWSWFVFGLGFEGFWIKMSRMQKVLRAVCGSGHFFLLLKFWLNFGSLTFFLLREDLNKILKFQDRINISDTWIIISSHDLSDLSSLNGRQIQLWVLLMIQHLKEKNLMLPTIYAFLCHSTHSFPLNFTRTTRMMLLKRKKLLIRILQIPPKRTNNYSLVPSLSFPLDLACSDHSILKLLSSSFVCF